MPPPPKPPGTRRRRSSTQTSWRTLDAGARPGRVPALPVRRPAWQPATRAWWRRVWRSPMAATYLEADLGALYRLAELVERFGRGELAVAGELRQLEDRFGLTPKARQLLQWQVLPEAPPAKGSSASAGAPAAAPSNVRRLRAVDPSAQPSTAGG